jgi:hypothetical protein
MVKLKTEIAELLPEPQEGKIYTISTCELFTSPVKGYKGLRVNMVAEDGAKVASSLWTRDIAGQKSKLGAFITVLGEETDAWEGRKIRFLAWRIENRKIEVL